MTDSLLRSVVHPTDFSPAGLDAFAHALRLAVAAKSHFYILHVERETEQADWVQFPRVRETLAAWDDGAEFAVASELGLRVEKAIIGSGAISLQTILSPIDGSVPYQDACQWVAAFERLAASIARIHPLHVGTSAPANASEFEGKIDVREGPVIETIISVAKEIGADIIAMPTAGHHGLFDALRGSVTERVLREAPCPVLAVPVM